MIRNGICVLVLAVALCFTIPLNSFAVPLGDGDYQGIWKTLITRVCYNQDGKSSYNYDKLFLRLEESPGACTFDVSIKTNDFTETFSLSDTNNGCYSGYLYESLDDARTGGDGTEIGVLQFYFEFPVTPTYLINGGVVTYLPIPTASTSSSSTDSDLDCVDSLQGVLKPGLAWNLPFDFSNLPFSFNDLRFNFDRFNNPRINAWSNSWCNIFNDSGTVSVDGLTSVKIGIDTSENNEEQASLKCSTKWSFSWIEALPDVED